MARQKKIVESELQSNPGKFLDIPEQKTIVSDLSNEEIKVKSKSLFDHLKEVTQNQRKRYFVELTDADKRTWVNYMVNRFLSMDPEFIEVVNETQKYTVGMQMDKECMYKMLIGIIPKSKVYLQYIKSKNETKYHKELIDIIKIHYLVSKKHALEYIDILHRTGKTQDLRNLLERYGYNEAQAQKFSEIIKD